MTELALAVGLVVAAAALFGLSVRVGMLLGLRLDRALEDRAAREPGRRGGGGS